MKRLLAWLARVYRTILHRVPRVTIDIETGGESLIAVQVNGGVTYIDLRIACSEHAQRYGAAQTNNILRDFGGDVNHLGGITNIADALYAIQTTIIAPEYNAKARHTRVGVSPHRGSERIYAIVMALWVPFEIFESRTIRDMLVDLGYAHTSHGPALSDLTQLGWLESGGDGLYAFTVRDPRGVDWTEEGHRLADMRAARKR